MSIKKLQLIGKEIAKVIDKEVGATVDVALLSSEVVISTEQLDATEAIIALIKKAGRTLLSSEVMEADEDFPQDFPAESVMRFAY